MIWSGTGTCEERDEAGRLKKRFLGDGIALGGSATPSSNERYYYQVDHLGSVRQVHDGSGNLLAEYDYDLFGVPSKKSGTYDCDQLFTGHLYHNESGLHLAPYRGYDANIGRWISPDPIEENGGINLYEYVLNGPTKFVDMLGLNPAWPTPPTNIPGGPWKWYPDPKNSRGGTLRPVTPPLTGNPPILTWSAPTNNPSEGNPNGYWKCHDGKGNTQRYDPSGKPISPGEAHPGRPGTSKPSSNPKGGVNSPRPVPPNGGSPMGPGQKGIPSGSGGGAGGSSSGAYKAKDKLQ